MPPRDLIDIYWRVPSGGYLVPYQLHVLALLDGDLNMVSDISTADPASLSDVLGFLPLGLRRWGLTTLGVSHIGGSG